MVYLNMWIVAVRCWCCTEKYAFQFRNFFIWLADISQCFTGIKEKYLSNIEIICGLQQNCDWKENDMNTDDCIQQGCIFVKWNVDCMHLEASGQL